MSTALASMSLPTEADTAALAQRMAHMCQIGDVFLLNGDIGAGKSTFARAFVRARLGAPDEDVPSPTFTIVQVYEHDAGDIWHCDLYRLGGPDGVVELGLDEAFDTAICLIEWPDKLGGLAPDNALIMTLQAGDNGHHVSLGGPASVVDRWSACLE